METPEGESTATTAMETPQRSPQPSMTVQSDPPQRSPQPSTVRGWSAQRSPQQSVSQAVSSVNDVLPPVRLKSALKPQDPAAPAAPPRREPGKLCHAPVTARTAKDMIGADTERSTGITYPYNVWGPCNPTKFGPVGDMPPNRGHKYNYQGKHETLMKDRLEKRDFGHVRHHCYRKNLVEPTGAESLAWMDPKRKEFWRTDVERALKRDEEKR